MAMKIAIAARRADGDYVVECECGTSWSGHGIEHARMGCSPALPVAEVVVHFKLQHPVELMDLRFSDGFKDWLKHYWELASLNEATSVFGASPFGV